MDRHGRAIRTYSRERVEHLPSSSHLHDPESDWWGEFCSATKAILDGLGAKVRVEAVTVTGMWPCLCIADGRGKPLGPAIVFDDEAHAFIDQRSPGHYCYELGPRSAWFKSNQARTWSLVEHVFTSHTYVAYRLTGSYYLDLPTAIGWGAVDASSPARWSEGEITTT